MSRIEKSTVSIFLIPLVILSATFFSGCNRKKKELVRRPRPVSVRTLTKEPPSGSAYFTATVASWKTEEIGFEVGGRVEMVVEPNTEIIARDQIEPSESKSTDEVDGKDDSNQEDESTDPIGISRRSGPRKIIARLETERYELQVAKAAAELTRAKQNLAAAKIEYQDSIPQQILAAKAKKTLAGIEFKRSEKLFNTKAGAEADVDRDRANQKDAEAQIEILNAALKSKAAEVISLENSVKQAESDLRDAKRNLEDCNLYASFNGQIAEVSVVPGSVVQAGTPAVVLQMMDPIKIEIEVSSELSRRLKRTDLVPISVTMKDGNKYEKELPNGEKAAPLGYLYLIDSVADPLTKTFTVTLLVENTKIKAKETADVRATTKDIWGLDFKFLPGKKEGELFVEQGALLKDDEGYYLWMITNLTFESREANDDFFKVKKLRVKVLDRTISWLGDWVFQQVTVDDPSFDPKLRGVIGELKVSSGRPEDWNGDTVYRDESQWLLRPGDLVNVDLTNSDTTDGFYVPMESIVRQDDLNYIFVVDEKDGDTFAKKIPVIVEGFNDGPVSTMRLIKASDKGFNLEGRQFIYEGAHYLIDGEPIAIASHNSANSDDQESTKKSDGNEKESGENSSNDEAKK